MNDTISIPAREILPDTAAVLGLLGVSPSVSPDPRVKRILSRALELFSELARPRALWAELSVDEFAPVYSGEGSNEPMAPLAEIYPRAEKLALFAVTVGATVCERIQELFAERDFATATMLDSAASEGADQLAALTEERYRLSLEQAGELSAGSRVLRYSPGYCGWHVSAQKALFARLNPERIGITLRESCLMTPLKSVSGVIIGGPASIHEFDDDFSFCADCETHECQTRL